MVEPEPLLADLLTSCNNFVASNAHASISCRDVSDLDKTEALEGLVLLVGCENVSAEILAERWEEFPEAARVLQVRTLWFLRPSCWSGVILG